MNRIKLPSSHAKPACELLSEEEVFDVLHRLADVVADFEGHRVAFVRLDVDHVVAFR